ncbi:MAG: hypothetical protein JRJ47_04350 [Deltaproteobacteria bacterium]|nr:hypothetical protein [Deltaproteobacteria bacterium]
MKKCVVIGIILSGFLFTVLIALKTIDVQFEKSTKDQRSQLEYFIHSLVKSGLGAY